MNFLSLVNMGIKLRVKHKKKKVEVISEVLARKTAK